MRIFPTSAALLVASRRFAFGKSRRSAQIAAGILLEDETCEAIGTSRLGGWASEILPTEGYKPASEKSTLRSNQIATRSLTMKFQQLRVGPMFVNYLHFSWQMSPCHFFVTSKDVKSHLVIQTIHGYWMMIPQKYGENRFWPIPIYIHLPTFTPILV